MQNGSAGAGKRAGYSDVADRQTRRRPGPSSSRWPRLIPSRIAPEILLCDSGPHQRQRACRASRPVKAYGQVVLSVNGQSEKCSICVRYSLRSDIHRALLRRKSEERGKKRYGDEERFEWSSPVLPMALVLAADPFCRLLPAYGQEQAVYFVRLAPPPGRESHSMCAN